jgi:hypothetical protein
MDLQAISATIENATNRSYSLRTLIDGAGKELRKLGTFSKH